MIALLLALLTAPLLSDSAPATLPTTPHSLTVAARRPLASTDIPNWFKRKKRHTPAYRRLRRR
ncbi:hypothetical protein [Hymenobacter sp. 102]|uniref:hypothetical protein n=1 Tax=Hymenobacter sp. 102 TaxID=3403152 RepID=UPI003CF789CD